MATLNAGGGTVAINMADNNTVNHAAQGAVVDSSEYTWTTTSGNTIRAYSFADDFTFSATSPLGGTVHALQAFNSYTVGGLAGSLVGMTAAPNNETYWRPILSGATTIYASATADFNGAGDYVVVNAGESLLGSADVFEGEMGGVSQTFVGDALDVRDGASLTGGNDEITMRTDGDIAGDAYGVHGTLTGGDDTIVVDGVFSSDSNRISGDIINLNDLEKPIAPSFVGGNDTIIVLNYGGGSEPIAGDLYDAFAPLGTSFGGDDLIDASKNSFFTQASGDIAGSLNHELRCGDDTLIGSLTHGNILYGDARFVFGGTLRPGADTLIGGNVDDTLYGDFGDEDGGSILINAAFTGNDLIRGGGGNDFLAGQVGDDILEGGSGDDSLDGGTNTSGVGDTAAFDQLNVAVSVDLNFGFAFGQGNDTLLNIENIRASSRNDSLGGNNLANRIEGLGGDDQIFGRAGNDKLFGGDGNDTIKGGADTDTLTGGKGADKLDGGGGIDFFNYDSVAESTSSISGRDLIENFSVASDVIDLGDIDAQAGVAGNQAFAFIGAAAFSAEGQIRAVTSGGHTLLQINTTGVSGAEMVIELNSIVAIGASNFIL